MMPNVWHSRKGNTTETVKCQWLPGFGEGDKVNSWSTGKPFCVIYAMVDIVFKTHRMGTTLVVQWLRFYIATAKGQGSISGQGNLIPHVATKTLCNEIHTHTHTHTHTYIYTNIYIHTTVCRAFPVAQKVRSPPAMQETRVQSLGQEEPLEKIWNGNPLQHSCLGNSMDRGARHATVHGVAKESDRTEQLNNIQGIVQKWTWM